MTWNHRVVRRIFPDGEILFGIHEVFYNDDGQPDMVTDDAVRVLGDDIDDLEQTLKWMRKALGQPILEYSDFEGGGKYYHG